MYFNIMTLAACTAMTEREQTAIECRVWYLEVVSIQYASALVLIAWVETFRYRTSVYKHGLGNFWSKIS